MDDTDISSLTVDAKELAAVLGVTPRRVRQLTEERVFQRVERGKYPLALSVRAYVAKLTAHGQEELRAEKLALLQAQRKRIELNNERQLGMEGNFSSQEAVARVIALEWFLRLRPVATWMFEELQKHAVDHPEWHAGALQGWLVGLRHEIDRDMENAVAEARRREIVIKRYEDLTRLMGRVVEHRSPDASKTPDREIWG